MNLINLLVKDVIPFAAQKHLDLEFLIKLIDYRFSTIQLNIEDDFEVTTYVANIRIVNNLISLLGINKNFNEKERTAYDDDLIVSMLENPSRLIKYKEFKLSIYSNHFADEIDLFEEYIEQSK